MSLPFLFLLIIILCAVGLAYLLFPEDRRQTPHRTVRKRKAASATRPPALPRSRSPDETMMARAGMTEGEAIRKVVEAFVDREPAATAKILRNWMREK
ncbi:exported hypothetical protein [Nitrospina gracilis 3/211]|uniref:Uncharacterized protein n=1 Tax=Nitrospina gracilis (strain 3/211) TaxID=1266370 RepID=M1Z2W0_NITG3|nr:MULTISPECIES: hypothetical protein [Nitrospina]MCF8724647.1 flagellar biosynthesis/type III secretory pathway M-ring protein FliF/YscJ [Nitrospina sp. Nb-3]CCQ91829.1 exported hypothetical protein [Nitrospina gracilis 3/211]